MSRRYNIRWNDNDNQELTRVVRNYNAKIRRLEKKHPELKNVLPEKTSVTQMKDLIETRQDLKRELNALKRFSKRGAEKIVDVPGSDYNLKTTKWQKEEMTRRIGIINRKRKKRLKEIAETEVTSRGESLGYTRGDIGMGKAEEVSLKPMKAFTPKMSSTDLKKKYRNILKESQSSYWYKRDLMLKENYIKSIEENFNPEDVKDIVEAIDKMDINAFREIFDMEGGIFEFSYPPDQEAYEGYLSSLKTIWIPNYGAGSKITHKKDIDKDLKKRIVKHNKKRAKSKKK